MQYSLSHHLGRTGGLLDPAVAEFASRSGATNLSGLDALIRYVRAEGLYDSFRIYPMKSAQNAGSGATVYGLGGLTSNEMTLVNSPTWGSGGITFAASSSQYADASDFLGGGQTQTWFSRITQSSATLSAIEVIAQHYSIAGSQISWAVLQNGSLAGDPYQIYGSPNGTTPIFQGTSAGSLGSAADRTVVAQHAQGGTISLWHNKTSRSLTITGASVGTVFDSNAVVRIAAGGDDGSPAAYLNAVFTAQAFITGALTTTQRETITDLINAL